MVTVIRGWEHSNIFTLASSEIWTTLSGNQYRVSIGGLFCEVSYQTK